MKNWSDSPTIPLASPCNGEQGGCYWCSMKNLPYKVPEITAPAEKLSSIPSRVNVSGKLQGAWGPLPNHYGELVLGAMIKSGEKMVTLEEAQPGSYPAMHDSPQDDVVVTGALPGVWRGQPRLYLDENSSIQARLMGGAEVVEDDKMLQRVVITRPWR